MNNMSGLHSFEVREPSSPKRNRIKEKAMSLTYRRKERRRKKKTKKKKIISYYCRVGYHNLCTGLVLIGYNGYRLPVYRNCECGCHKRNTSEK